MARTSPLKPLGSVLVIGGCGFLGSHIVSMLKQRYPSPATSVAVLDLKTSANNFEGVAYHAADLSSPDAVSEVFTRVQPDVVIHTASIVLVHTTSSAKAKMHQVNVEGTRNLLAESKKTGVKAFIYTSSSSVVSDARTDLINADERYLTIRGKLQNEYYSDTKAEAEGIVLDANTRPSPTIDSADARNAPLLTLALRPSGIFGERDVQVLPPIINALHDGRSAYQLGYNENLFDVTYVGNAAHAHLLAATRLLETYEECLAKPAAAVTTTKEEDEDDALAARVDGEPFFITNGTPIPFWDFARLVWQEYYEATGQRCPAPATPAQRRVLPRALAIFIAAIMTWVCWILRLPEPSLDPQKVRFACMTRFFRISKAEVLLGYEPVWTVDEGVKRAAKYFADRRFPTPAGAEPKKTR